ncbi:hypothetical protein AAEY33_07520 [Peribacillus simplex]|jgi:hypothetical protein|uniref:hypothetical protein n=1 Tax=Peribacillus simplex TaxID=1478 RepID=UPI003265C616
MRIGFGKDEGRYFATTLSGLLYTHVGYIMEGGMSKRQALYDRYDGRNGNGEK